MIPIEISFFFSVPTSILSLFFTFQRQLFSSPTHMDEDIAPAYILKGAGRGRLHFLTFVTPFGSKKEIRGISAPTCKDVRGHFSHLHKRKAEQMGRSRGQKIRNYTGGLNTHILLKLTQNPLQVPLSFQIHMLKY